MSDTKHTPEPWSEEDFYRAALFHVNGVTYLQFKNRDTGEVSGRLNIPRIVACVNACKEYTNDELEYGMIEKEREAVMAWERAMMAAIGEDGVKSVSEAIAKLKAERDELLAALKIIYNRHLGLGPATGEDAIFCFRQALAAIDKAGGTT